MQFLNRNSYFCCPNREGVIAQLVEQWTENPCVAGSTPARTTKKTQLCWVFFMPLVECFAKLRFDNFYQSDNLNAFAGQFIHRQ